MSTSSGSKTTGYHLFLEPSGEAKLVLEKAIVSLATKYGGPVFSPHLTVLAGLPDSDEATLIEKAETLSTSAHPLTLSLEGFATQDSYFKALYLTTTNQEQVMTLHQRAQELFNISDSKDYVPHVSLLYGLYSEEEKKESVATLASLIPISFPVSSLTLWKTPGETTTWKRIAEFPFPTEE